VYITLAACVSLQMILNSWVPHSSRFLRRVRIFDPIGILQYEFSSHRSSFPSVGSSGVSVNLNPDPSKTGKSRAPAKSNTGATGLYYFYLT